MTPREREDAERQREIHELADASLRDDSSPVDASRLEELLRADATARLIYVRYLQDTFRLRHWAIAAQASEAAPFDATPSQPSMVAARVARRMPRGYSLALAACVMLLAYFASMMAYVSLRQPIAADVVAEKVETSAPFATLVALENCVWNDAASLPVGSALQQPRLALESGAAAIQFADGATVTLQGPAIFELRSTNRGFLAQGRLHAYVPPRATGFTIDTSVGRVVDLGTEFGVAVDETGEMHVEVLTGSVQLVADHAPANSNTKTIPNNVVKAGEAKRVARNASTGVVAIESLRGDRARFTPTPLSKLTRRIYVHGTQASSETYGCLSRHLIDGAGMHGDSHANDMEVGMTAGDYNMWMTRMGEVQGAYVLFDLGKPHRLDSMKVWNFNDSRYGHHDKRGIKQADIYTSMTGNANPLANPKDWQLVAENYQFKPASGAMEYDTPEVIDFKHCEGRFVAIVVDDHFKPDRPDTPPDQQCVGLSEVQFFGERVSQP